MLRRWQTEFLANASRAFDETRQATDARRKKEAPKKEQAQMLKAIGQLTLKRDFLQDCFGALEDRSPNFIKTNEALSVRQQCELLGI